MDFIASAYRHLNQPNYADLLKRIASWPKFGSCVPNDRFPELLDRLPRPGPALKLTGSNGKGSVAAMLRSLLRASNLAYGCFTSPHLICYNERFDISGANVETDELIRALDRVYAQARSIEALRRETFGAFDLFSGAAALLFAEAKLPHLVLEAGIGGRHDPTRFFPGGVCAITSLDLEHTYLLGDTLCDIAADKMDICPDGGTLVLGDLPAEVMPLLQSRSADRGIQLIPVSKATSIDKVEKSSSSTRFDLSIGDMQVSDIVLPLIGEHQLNNARVAVTMFQVHLQRLNLLPHPARFARVIREGLAKTFWPGRAWLIHQDPSIYVDVGHTPAAAAALAQTMHDSLEEPYLLITGISQNKEARGILLELLPFASEVVCAAATHLGTPTGQLRHLVEELAPEISCQEAGDLDQCIEIAQRHRGPVLVAGSLFLGMSFAARLQNFDPGRLHFF